MSPRPKKPSTSPRCGCGHAQSVHAGYIGGCSAGWQGVRPGCACAAYRSPEAPKLAGPAPVTTTATLPRQCSTSTTHGRCRRVTRRANGLCTECDKQHAARQFAVLDSYLQPKT